MSDARFQAKFSCVACGPTNEVVSIGHSTYCTPCLARHLERHPKQTIVRLARRP